MNIKGKLVEIFDTVQVTETFKKREFIIEDNKIPEYPEYIKVELIQDKVSLLDSLNVGDEVNVLINIKGRKWEDKEGNIRYFNSIQGWKIESENQGINQETPNEAESQESDDSDLPLRSDTSNKIFIDSLKLPFEISLMNLVPIIAP